jgi:hypothetical protein
VVYESDNKLCRSPLPGVEKPDLVLVRVQGAPMKRSYADGSQ